MTMEPNEDVVEYGERFQNAAREGRLQEDQGLAMRFLASLQDHIQENVCVVWHSRNRRPKIKNLEKSDVSQAWCQSTGAMHISIKVSNTHNVVNHQSQSKHIGAQSTTVTSNTSQNNASWLNLRPNQPKESTTMAEERFKRGECVHCGEEWDKSHRCQEYREAHKKKKGIKLSNLCINTMTVAPEVSHPADEALL